MMSMMVVWVCIRLFLGMVSQNNGSRIKKERKSPQIGCCTNRNSFKSGLWTVKISFWKNNIVPGHSLPPQPCSASGKLYFPCAYLNNVLSQWSRVLLQSALLVPASLHFHFIVFVNFSYFLSQSLTMLSCLPELCKLSLEEPTVIFARLWLQSCINLE